jgi:putative hydroxymethylpyrimidine transport system substrate-binding protein
MSLSRRGFLGTTAAVAGGVVLGACGKDSSSKDGGSAAPGVTKLRYVHNWPGADYSMVPLAVGQARGFYPDANLDVPVTFPPDTATAVKIMSTGGSDVSLITTTDMAAAIENKVPITSIANFNQTNDWGFFTKPGVTLTSVEDLKGKRIAGYGDTWTKAMITAVLHAQGWSDSDIKQVTVDDALPLLLAGKIDVATGTADYLIPRIVDETGQQPGVLLAKDCGAPNVPIFVYAARNDFLKDNSNAVKAFLSATAKATEWAISNPDEAVTEYENEFPKNGSTHAQNLSGWQGISGYLKNEQGQLFTQTDSQWAELNEALVSAGALKDVQDPSSYYTNDYISA